MTESSWSGSVCHGYRGRSVTAILREGYVTADFLALVRQEERTAEEESHLAVLKQEMANRLLGSPAAAVYDVDGEA